MQATALNTTQLGDTGLEITRIGFGAWAIGGGGWEFGWGPQDDERVDRRDPPRARARDQLDRHRRCLRLRPLRGDRRPRARGPAETSGHTSSRRLAARGSRTPGRAQPQARLDPARGATPASSGSASTRSTSTRSTGRSPTRTSRRAGPRWPSSSEQGLVRHIGVSNFDVEQLQPDPADRAGRDAAAAVLADRARRRAGDPARSPSARGSA